MKGSPPELRPSEEDIRAYFAKYSVKDKDGEDYMGIKELSPFVKELIEDIVKNMLWFKNDYVFKKGTKHQIGLWKNEDGTLYVEIKEKVDSSAQPQATQQSSQSYTPRDPSQIMGTPEFQKAQMQKSHSQNDDEEDIPF